MYIAMYTMIYNFIADIIETKAKEEEDNKQQHYSVVHIWKNNENKTKHKQEMVTV